MGTPHFRPIALILIRKTFVWATLCALVICSVQGIVSYQLVQKRFELALRDIANTNVPQLSVSIWDIEPDALRRQMEVIAERHQIGYARLEVRTGQVFESGNVALRASVGVRRFEIPYPQRTFGSIGTLEIAPDHSAFYSEVVQSLIGVFLGYGVLTLLICFMLAAVLRRELQQPMQRIAKFVTDLSPETLTTPLTLERPPRSARDEIDLVAEGFSTLQAGINNHITNLDQLVVERTAQLESALESIRQLSITDSLTGAFNRHLFNERFPQEVDRAERYERPLSVIFSDIDHFKQINDSEGHAAGDAVLHHVADVFSGNLRSDIDWLVRFGGEEFVIVLPETPLTAAVSMAERLRSAIAAKNIEINGKAVLVTASFGVAQLKPKEMPEALLQRADSEMYAAKSAGRNRVLPAVYSDSCRTTV